MHMLMRMIIGFIIAIILPSVAVAGEALGGAMIYADADDYVAQAFSTSEQPKVSTLWPAPQLREQLKDILGHKPSLRFRYWGKNGKTVWVLDEVGKDQPITAGVVIEQGKISDMQVLVFRESRGWEIKHDFFTNQFARLWLKQNHRLSATVDNITGATLSVKAMTRMARAALLLHEHSNQNVSTLATAR
jgi:hypothetical protein